LVRTRLEAEIVDLEAGRVALVDALEPREPAAELAQRHTLGITVEPSACRIELDVVVRPLIAVNAVHLRSCDCRLSAVDCAARKVHRKLKAFVEEPVPQIETARVGGAAKEGIRIR